MAVLFATGILSGKDLSVIRNVDVVVAGGSSAAVAAAVAAKEAGASVFLAAPRPYLGEDLAGELRVISEKDGRLHRTTPLAVKNQLDEAMLRAGAPYLTGAIPSAIVKDENGNACGIVISDRSGRQVIRAKVIIDATSRGRLARAAGGATLPFPAGTYSFERMVIAAEAPKGENLTVKEYPFVMPTASENHLRGGAERHTKSRSKFYLCTIRIPMKDGSARSFAGAEQIARDATFGRTQVDAADTLHFIAPDNFICEENFSGAWENVDKLPVGVFKPKGVSNVFVLSALAGVSRAVAEKLVEPDAFSLAGRKVGIAAAECAKGINGAGKKLTVVQFDAGAGDFVPADKVMEHNKPLPEYLVNAKGSIRDASEFPVIAECDTVVAGAGTGGAPAGISAARNGAKTIVCEYLYDMGGVQTEGKIGYYWYGNKVGFTKEIDSGVKTIADSFSQGKSEWYRREQRKAGCEIWYGSMVCGVVVNNNRAEGLLVVMSDGTSGIVRSKNIIDSTGNAEIPAMAQTDTEFITGTELSVQGAGQAKETLGRSYANSDIGFVDDTDAADLFYFALRSRLSLPRNTWDQAQIVNSRERRRMVGAFYMTPPDVINSRTYPDVVVRTYSNFDTHGQTAHDAFFILDPGHKPMSVNLPYRCMLPKTLDGVIVTGLGISAHRDAMPILRMQPDVQNQGYVAGKAAAMAAKNNVALRDVNIRELQQHLVDKGIIPPEVMEWKDSFPLSDDAFQKAVRDLPKGYQGLNVLMTDLKRAIPLLQNAHHVAEGENRFVYAHVLAMLGLNDGEEQLLGKFKAMDWDDGWNYRGMGQFNRSVSRVDSYAIALGHCKSKAAVPALIEKAGKLTRDSAYSHFRSVAKALEEIGDPAAVPALERVLKLDGVGGQAKKMTADVPLIPGYKDKEGDWERTLALRELCIARALYRLGDTKDGLGRKTLEAYAADPRRAYASHALQVLNSK